MNRLRNLAPLALLLVLASDLSVLGQAPLAGHAVLFASIRINNTDRDRDGLMGPVRRIKTEMVKLSNKGGKSVEGQRVIIESVAYDIKGAKVENAYYPVPGAALTGKEVYKYDEKGNIVEMTMVDVDGTLLSKEVYSYESDTFGNWIKMTTSVAVIEGGKISYEPTEVTYRSISYYLDEATLARLNQPAVPALAPTTQIASNVQGASGSGPKLTPANSATASRPAAPPPGGGSLVTTNSVSAAALFNSPVNTTSPDALLKIAGEAPPPATVKPTPKPLLKPVSGGVLNGKAIELPKPLYPQTAKAARATGLVSVEVVIDEKGKVISAKAVDGHALLRGAAVSAAQGARFSPTLLSGQAVKVAGQINYTFTLQ